MASVKLQTSSKLYPSIGQSAFQKDYQSSNGSFSYFFGANHWIGFGQWSNNVIFAYSSKDLHTFFKKMISLYQTLGKGEVYHFNCENSPPLCQSTTKKAEIYYNMSYDGNPQRKCDLTILKKCGSANIPMFEINSLIDFKKVLMLLQDLFTMGISTDTNFLILAQNVVLKLGEKLYNENQLMEELRKMQKLYNFLGLGDYFETQFRQLLFLNSQSIRSMARLMVANNQIEFKRTDPDGNNGPTIQDFREVIDEIAQNPELQNLFHDMVLG